MKNLVILVAFLFAGSYAFANEMDASLDRGAVCTTDLSLLQVGELQFLSGSDSVTEYKIEFVQDDKTLYDCKITIKGNFEGNEIDIEVTIHDVSWVGCQTLKAAVKVALATM